MHEAHVNLFFKNALKNANLLTSRQKRDQAISYIAGFMCHYIGDAICHPYIYGRIDHNPHSPNTYTHALHAALENDIDALLLYKFKRKKPSEFNQAATICLNGFEMQFVSDFLSKIINETFYPITYKNHFQVLISFHTFVLSNYRSNSKSLPYEDSPNDEKKCFIL